jgi:hypothetical protein
MITIDQRAFDLDRILAVEPNFLAEDDHQLNFYDRSDTKKGRFGEETRALGVIEPLGACA